MHKHLEASNLRNIFAIPLRDKVLIYAPLYDLSALLNRAAVRELRDELTTGTIVSEDPLAQIIQSLNDDKVSEPSPKEGDFVPSFLGLIPTRDCQLACRYCDFLSSDSLGTMNLELARDAVRWYLQIAEAAEVQFPEIHFFGGEPFYADEVLDLAVNLAHLSVRPTGRAVRFEAATNGILSDQRCRWAAEHFDTIVLSFDGPAGVHNLHRPYKDERDSFERVARSAAILAEGNTNLFIRACVTAQTVERMPDIAAWFGEKFHPRGVCFEPIQPGPLSKLEQLEPPEPWDFATQFIRAARILETLGIEAIYSAADVSTRQVSFCPTGKDVAIVSPDGTVSSCYLPPHSWRHKGLDLSLGTFGNSQPNLDAHKIAETRNLNVHNKPLCVWCFCKWHCAGGCHVNHDTDKPPGSYDRLCIQTRIISLRNILRDLGWEECENTWLNDRGAVEQSIYQTSDLLCDWKE